jgi:hypothetical protein
VNILAWISATLVISFNIYMLGTDFLLPLFSSGGWWILLGIIAVLIAIFLFGLLVYLVIRTDEMVPSNWQPAESAPTPPTATASDSAPPSPPIESHESRTTPL